MGLPTVAIVGRPNVGKSSLLNALAGRRVSIVEPTPGVTRDRVSALCDVDGLFVELVDTGGYGIVDRDDLTEHVERQIRFAIERADLILFVVDVRDGVMPLDTTMAGILRNHHSRVLLVANKADAPEIAPQSAEFERLGFGEPICVSAAHGLGRADLRTTIAERLRRETAEMPIDPVMKVALVGRRNTGKSTFINALAGEERVIVSEVAGTTRDAVDVLFEKENRTFLAIDTAGVRKRSKLADSIEFYATSRVHASVRRADVVLMLLDAEKSTSMVDKKLARLLADEFKPVVIVINKWDLAKGRASTEEYGEYLTKTLVGLDFAPVVFTSAKSNHNVWAAIDTATALFNQNRTRVGTGVLNRALQEVMALRGPSQKRGTKPPRIYFATQVAVCPPTLVLFVNHVSSIDENYMRFLTNQFRERLPFSEVPFRLALRPHRQPVESAVQ